jgi:hypothetical protein
MGSRYTAVGIETGLRAGMPGLRFRAGSRDFSLLRNVQAFSWAHTATDLKGTYRVGQEWMEVYLSSPLPHTTWTSETLFFVKISIGISYFTIFYVGSPNIIDASGSVQNSEVRLPKNIFELQRTVMSPVWRETLYTTTYNSTQLQKTQVKSIS